MPPPRRPGSVAASAPTARRPYFARWRWASISRPRPMATKSSCARVPPARPVAPAGNGPQRCRAGPAFVWQFLLVAVLAGPVPTALAVESEPPLSIGVQSAVTHLDAPQSRPGGRLYAILAVQQFKSEVRLVKPVDEMRLTRHLVAALDSRSFHLADDQQKPEILLTVQYGRGWQKNPYLSNIGKLPVEQFMN